MEKVVDNYEKLFEEQRTLDPNESVTLAHHHLSAKVNSASTTCNKNSSSTRVEKLEKRLRFSSKIILCRPGRNQPYKPLSQTVDFETQQYANQPPKIYANWRHLCKLTWVPIDTLQRPWRCLTWHKDPETIFKKSVKTVRWKPIWYILDWPQQGDPYN